MTDKRFLWELCRKGKPLAEVHVYPREGVNVGYLIGTLNALGPDVAAGEDVYNSLMRSGKLRGHRPSAIMDATKEALDRLFGWRLRRVLPSGFQCMQGESVETLTGVFSWEEVVPICHMPTELVDLVESMSLSQPGTNDNGNADLIEYTLPDARPN